MLLKILKMFKWFIGWGFLIIIATLAGMFSHFFINKEKYNCQDLCEPFVPRYQNEMCKCDSSKRLP